MSTPTDLPTLVASAAPGTRHAALLTTSTEPATEVPAFALRGGQPGPTLLVTAGVHGAEYASIEAAYRLAALDAAQLAGTLVVLPIVNQPAYRVRAIYGNPVDGKNLNRQFPGDPAGSFAPRLAHWLTDGWVRHADAYLDLHGGDLNEALTPFALYARGDERARALAEAFGIPYVIASGSAGHSYTAAAALGVPAVLAEAGGQGLFRERDVLTLVDGSRRAMQHLGMLQGAPTPRPTIAVERFVVLTSAHEGRWYPRVRLDAHVEAGELLGEIRDLLGDVVQAVTAPVSGTVLYYVATLAIDRGDPLVGIGATALPD
jgi:predicted deacylase